jgi:hypothetical protein
MKIPPDQKASITDLLLAGNKIGAIKDYRDFSGSSLLDAKNIIEQIESELKTAHPDRYVSAPTDRMQRERIYELAHLAQAIESLPEHWTICSFRPISMGWCAELQSRSHRVMLTSHRHDISAAVCVGGKQEWFELTWGPVHSLGAHSDFQIVRHWIERAKEDNEPST